ncbi:MAG TPA: tetratricopeptide repeat protein [Anaeromyxobacteraceae bacterium]|nr:tetratricopeptide repeat protein [Anaeromyxobacteraceae bacterium]
MWNRATSPQATSARWERVRGWLPAALLAALAVATYGNTLRNGFVWDDQYIVVDNPETRDLGALGRVLLSPDEASSYYRPLNRASYLVDFQLFGMNAAGFHAVGVALHVVNVLLLLALGRRLFGTRPPAFLAAALLAVHPIQAEAVDFISARNNLLVLAFSLSALLLFLEALRRDSAGRAWLSGLALLLGLLSKEQALGVVPVVVGCALVPGLRAPAGGRRSLAFLVPHASAIVLYAVLRSLALGPGAAGGAILPGLPSRMALQAYAVPHYLGLALFPAGLTIFHDIPAAPLSIPWILPAWVAIAAAAYLLCRRWDAPVAIASLWLAFQYVPISNVVPIPSAPIAERYLYVPAAGLWLLAAAALDRLPRRLGGKALAACAGLAIAALAARTIARNADWRDDLSLMASAVRVNPRSVDARFNLGEVLRERGDLPGAVAQWEEALRLSPDDPRPLVQLGTLAARGGDYARAEAYYRRALQAEPGEPLAHFNLARVCDLTGRPGEALDHYRRFAAAAPDRRTRAQRSFAARRIRELEGSLGR